MVNVGSYRPNTHIPSGLIWGVNSFDQWGVELGKAMASLILPAVREPEKAKSLDASTQELLAYTRKHL